MFSMSILAFSEREKNQILYLRRKVMVREISGKKTLFPSSLPPFLSFFSPSFLHSSLSPFYLSSMCYQSVSIYILPYIGYLNHN